MKISGVYKITNTITDDFYIGSSKNIKIRWNDHKEPSTWKRYSHLKLYKDMAQFGLDNFLFEVLEETEALKEREQYYIDQLKPSYNKCRAYGLDIEMHKEASRRCNKAYQNRLCLYEGKTLTLNALRLRFSRQGIAYPSIEAKKYLIKGEIDEEITDII